MEVHKTKDSDKLLELVKGVGGDKERCMKEIEMASVQDRARCSVCVYKRSVPGNAHIQCAYDWLKALKHGKVNMIPLGNGYGIGQGWYMFPVLYDPIWQVVKCQAFSTVHDDNFSLDGKNDAIVSMMAVYQLIQNYALAVIKVPKDKDETKEQSGGKENVEEGNVEKL
jgi:hypothetical protein